MKNKPISLEFDVCFITISRSNCANEPNILFSI